MIKTEVSGLPRPRRAFSQAVLIDGFLYTAGIGPFDPETRQICGLTIEEQTHQTMINLSQVLEHAGLTFDHAIKVTVHLQNLARDFDGFDQTYRSFFSSPPYPVRTTVGSHLRAILVEMDLVAHI